ncbi:MAG: DUF4912 domain-containing protein [Spirochaetaceae bacterium]|nr:DUF4912 domain-containing protein [Spirochaetaceae bacterium]
MNPEKLSLLSDKELALLAERMGIFVPEGLDRLFIVEEILSALEEDDHERVFSHDGTGHVEEKKLSGRGFLPTLAPDNTVIPSRYSETMIRALPRDPAWIYAYWDIAEQRHPPLGGEDAEANLFLRVVEIDPQSSDRKDFFDISISYEDWKWYINIPQPGAHYRVDLCQRMKAKIRVLARSNELKMPVYYIRNTPRIPQITKSLLILSGIEGLHLTEPRDENPNRILMADGE